MRDTILLLGVLTSAYAAFLLLALSQTPNWNLVLNAPVRCQPPRQAFRIAGAALLVASLTLALLRDGPAFGSILWTVVLTITGMAAVATLTWQKPLLRMILHSAGSRHRSPAKAQGIHNRVRQKEPAPAE